MSASAPIPDMSTRNMLGGRQHERSAFAACNGFTKNLGPMFRNRNSRDFGAWLGLIPRQIATGGTVLGKISNRHLRVPFVQAAWVGGTIKPKA